MDVDCEMSYFLESINTDLFYRCEEEKWINVLEKARQNGWEPEGTVLDVEFEMDYNIYSDMSYLEILFQVIKANMRCLEWDGNYTDNENQLVKETDVGELLYALEGRDIPEGLMKLLQAGSFRICDY